MTWVSQPVADAMLNVSSDHNVKLFKERARVLSADLAGRERDRTRPSGATSTAVIVSKGRLEAPSR